MEKTRLRIWKFSQLEHPECISLQMSFKDKMVSFHRLRLPKQLSDIARLQPAHRCRRCHCHCCFMPIRIYTCQILCLSTPPRSQRHRDRQTWRFGSMFACDSPAEHGYCAIRGLDEKPLPEPSAPRTDRQTKRPGHLSKEKAVVCRSDSILTVSA